MNQTNKSFFEVEDGTLYYEQTGDGFPLVLSHAAFLDSRMFDGLVELLAPHYRVIRYDMRGYGQSSPVKGPMCRRKDLAALLEYLGVTQAHLLGCSNGGEISLDLALEKPQLAASLTLVGSTPSGFKMEGAPPPKILEMMAAMQSGDLERASELQIQIWLDSDFREPAQVEPGLRLKALEMNRIPIQQNTFFTADVQPLTPLDPPAVNRLEEVTCPVMITVGSLDHAEVVRAAAEMTTHIPNARQIIFKDCGHVPSFEKPELFAGKLLEFLGAIK
jgi:pimeloyl-ACP methyl ester carboxylesterase